MKIKFLLDQPQTQHIQIIRQTIDIDIYTFINRLAIVRLCEPLLCRYELQTILRCRHRR